MTYLSVMTNIEETFCWLHVNKNYNTGQNILRAILGHITKELERRNRGINEELERKYRMLGT